MGDENETSDSRQKKKSFSAKFRSKIAKVTSGTSSNSEELAGRLLALVRLPPKCEEDSKKLLEIRRLLQKGAPSNYCNSLGERSALHIACITGDYLAARELVNFGADVNIKDGIELSPLHLAARMGRNEMIRLLIDNGAKINCQNRMRESPLHEAAAQECPDTIRILLDRNANTALVAEHSTARTTYFGNATPFSYTIRAGKLECILVFLQRGEGLDSFDVLAFLQLAHDKCMNLKVLRLLIEAGLQIQRFRPLVERQKFKKWPEEFWTWLESPKPLHVQCRQLIRSTLGQKSLGRARELPLPQSAIDRLTYVWPDCNCCVNLCSRHKKNNTFNIYDHRLPCQCI